MRRWAVRRALVARPYYYGPPAYAYAYAYEPSPGYPDDAEAYCEQRSRSYDPASGTLFRL